MLPTDVAIAALCGLIYQPSAIAGGFDYYDAGMDDGVCWALKHLDGFDVVVFRGSVTLRDWVCDARAIAISTRVGHVHDGFYAGMEKMWSEARAIIKQPAIVSGHSLGAARAGVLAALMIADGLPPVARVVLGEPKPGLLDFAKYIGAIPARSYRNGDARHHDLVTDVPFSFPPEQYVHPTPIVPVCCRPEDGDFADLGVFAWHHIQLYVAAVTAAAAQLAA